MKYLSVIPFFTLVCWTVHAQQLTVFEQSNGTRTATYEQGISFYQELAERSPLVHLQTFGPTDSGHPLHLVLISGDSEFDIEKIKASGRAILLINNAIHPGEPAALTSR